MDIIIYKERLLLRIKKCFKFRTYLQYNKKYPKGYFFIYNNLKLFTPSFFITVRDCFMMF